MTAMIERNPRQGVELYKAGDVGMPYVSPRRVPAVVRVTWILAGVAIYGCLAGLVARALYGVATFHGVAP